MIERFSSSSGRWLGASAIAVLALAAVLVLAEGPDREQLGILFWLATGALVCWIALVRPAVQAREDHLLLRNLLRDIEVPWHLVEQVRVAQTLRVQTGDKVHHGVAIGRSARSDLRAQREGHCDSSPTSPDYTDYIVDRINQLAHEQSSPSAGRTAVTYRWAWPELALILMLAVAGAALRWT